MVNPTGSTGLIGVYLPHDPGASGPHAQGEYQLPLGMIWNKGLTVGMGQAPVKRYNAHLRDLIIAGRIRPRFLVSHRLPLDQAPEAYRLFDERTQGYRKIILEPAAA